MTVVLKFQIIYNTISSNIKPPSVVKLYNSKKVLLYDLIAS